MGTVTDGFDARLANQPFLVVTSGHSGVQPEHQSARKSKFNMVGYPAWCPIPELV